MLFVLFESRTWMQYITNSLVVTCFWIFHYWFFTVGFKQSTLYFSPFLHTPNPILNIINYIFLFIQFFLIWRHPNYHSNTIFVYQNVFCDSQALLVHYIFIISPTVNLEWFNILAIFFVKNFFPHSTLLWVLVFWYNLEFY